VNVYRQAEETLARTQTERDLTQQQYQHLVDQLQQQTRQLHTQVLVVVVVESSCTSSSLIIAAAAAVYWSAPARVKTTAGSRAWFILWWNVFTLRLLHITWCI